MNIPPIESTSVNRRVIQDYTLLVSDFAQNLQDLDEKYGTYLKLEIIDLQVPGGLMGQPVAMVSYARSIQMRDVTLNEV